MLLYVLGVKKCKNVYQVKHFESVEVPMSNMNLLSNIYKGLTTLC